MNENLGLLYATPSFLEGMARVLDIGNTFTQYNTMDDAREADFLALRSDWRAIGEDFENALAEYEDTEKFDIASSNEGIIMAPTLTPETETQLRTATKERNPNLESHEDTPKQSSTEWETRLWSLGQSSRSVPLPLDATSREAIYED